MRIFLQSIGTAAAIAAVVFAGVVLNANSAVSETQHHVVEIRDLEFVPAELMVAPGDTITWINHDFVPHTVTADDDSWGSTTLKSGDSWKTTVQAGLGNSYFCTHHPSMTARVRVVAPN